MRYFILGHSGFVGEHLTSKLIQLGHDVITDLRYWDEKYDALINLAAKTHISKTFDAELIKSNIILVDKVFKRSERVIQASSCSSKHDTNPYAQSKMWAEYLTLKHNNAIALRFFNIYGPGASRGIVWHLMNLSDGAKLNVRGPDLTRDYIFVDDVVKEIIIHMKPDGRFFDLRYAREKAKEDGRDLPEVLNEFIAKGNLEHLDLNATRGVVDVGTGIGTSTMDLVNLFQKISGREFDISVSEPGDNEPQSMVADHAVPHIDLKNGIEKMLEYA